MKVVRSLRERTQCNACIYGTWTFIVKELAKRCSFVEALFGIDERPRESS